MGRPVGSLRVVDVTNSLGDIFAGSERVEGYDLEHTVRVPPAVCSEGGRYALPVPRRLDRDGLMVERAAGPDADNLVAVSIPAGSPERFRLRIRGAGAIEASTGLAGDLLLTIAADSNAPAVTRLDALQTAVAPETRLSTVSPAGRTALATAGLVISVLLVLTRCPAVFS